jgi:hypothetical protein
MSMGLFPPGLHQRQGRVEGVVGQAGDLHPTHLSAQLPDDLGEHVVGHRSRDRGRSQGDLRGPALPGDAGGARLLTASQERRCSMQYSAAYQLAHRRVPRTMGALHGSSSVCDHRLLARAGGRR